MTERSHNSNTVSIDSSFVETDGTILNDADNTFVNSTLDAEIPMPEEYRLLLVPFSHPISLDDVPEHLQSKTIILKKDAFGFVRAYVLRNNSVLAVSSDCGFTSHELEIVDFPEKNQNPIVIRKEEYPELFDKVALRCGFIQSYFGWLSTQLYSISCGIATIAAFKMWVISQSIAMLTPLGPLFYLVSAIIGLSSYVANYRMCLNNLSEIFVTGIQYLFMTKVKDPATSEYVSTSLPLSSRILLGIGAACSLAYGIAFGVLTYASAIGLTDAFPLATLSGLLPPLGVFFGTIALVCLSLLMLKPISNLLKSNSNLANVKKIINNIFHFDSKEESIFYRGFVWFCIGVGSLGMLTLTVLGPIYTQFSCVDTIVKTFKLTSELGKNAVMLLVGGLAFLAQLPFTTINALNPILRGCYRWPKQKGNEEKDLNEKSVKENYFVLIFGAFASAINAVANGLIALHGKPFDLRTVAGVGTVGAMTRSINATLGNTIAKVIPEPLVPPVTHQGTQFIHESLAISVAPPTQENIEAPLNISLQKIVNLPEPSIDPDFDLSINADDPSKDKSRCHFA